ncbi:WD repeat protein C31A2,14, putative, partial [Rhizoctonia solani AG-3 Rhs1AP]
MPPRRISYVIPAPQDPPPQLALPPIGVPRNGQTSPIFIPIDSDANEPFRNTPRPSHPQHRLPISALAIDKSTQLVDRSSPEGILYTSGRDGLVAAWELGVPMRKRSLREKERKRHWEALTGWDEVDDDSDEEDEEEMGKPPRPMPPVDENGWAYEDRWEVTAADLKPARFRQSVQLHTDWINDIVLCNMNQTVVSASSDGTLRTYNPHSTGTPNILGTHSDYVRCLTYAPGPRWVASGSFDRTVKLWDVSRAVGLTGSRLDSSAELASLSMGESDPKSSIYAIATDPAGTLVAAGGPERVILTGSSDASIKLWSLPMRRCIHTFSVHSDSVWALHSTHPQLHNFLSGDRAGWICRFDVTQPVRPVGSDTFNPASSIQFNTSRPGFTSTHTPRHSIAGTLSLQDKDPGNEMDLGDAYCVVIGRAGYESRNADGNRARYYRLDLYGRYVGMDREWELERTTMARRRLPVPTRTYGSPPPRVGSPGPRPTPSSPPSLTSAARKRVSIEVSYTLPKPEPEIALVAVPARIPSVNPPSFVLVPYTTLVRLAEPNLFKPGPHDPETATLYSHSGVSVHRNAHREDLAMGSGFFGLPPSGNTIQTTSSGAPPSLNHTSSNLPLASPPLPHPNTLPIASDVSEAVPLSTTPADEITGSHGLVRSVVLNDRVHALSVDTRGEVAVWDVVRGTCRGVFVLGKHAGTGKSKLSPREALDLVRDRVEGESMTPAWIKVDTRVGDLTVHLEEPRCFDAEVYADELDWVDLEGMKLENPHEHRLNLGKWVLTNLFADFIRAELALSAELTSPTPRATNAGLPPASMAVLSLPPVNEGQASLEDEGINSMPASPRPAPGSPALAPATPLALGSMPLAPASPLVGVTGLRTPRATHISLTSRPTHIPLPTRARSASEASVGGFGLGLGLGSPSGSGLGSATLAPMMTPAILPENDAPAALSSNVLSPIRELQSPGMLALGTMSPGQSSPGEKLPGTASTATGPGGDYFSVVKAAREKDGTGVMSPTEPVTPGGGGIMGRLKNLGKTGKRGPVVTGTLGAMEAASEESNAVENEPEVEERPDPERTKHLNLLSSILSTPLSPPHPNDAPHVTFPPNTIVTISEMTTSAEASGGMVLFSGSVGTLGADVEALEMVLPGWLLEYLLSGRFNLPPSGAAGQKMGFLLLPWKGGQVVLPELVGSQSRLTASRFLRVSKVVQYVHDKLLNAAKEQTQETSEKPDPMPEEARDYEVLCNEQVLHGGMTLAAVRQFVWRNAGELVMHYRVKES